MGLENVPSSLLMGLDMGRGSVVIGRGKCTLQPFDGLGYGQGVCCHWPWKMYPPAF